MRKDPLLISLPVGGVLAIGIAVLVNTVAVPSFVALLLILAAITISVGLEGHLRGRRDGNLKDFSTLRPSRRRARRSR